MQTVVTILMVLVCFSFLLKQTFLPRGAMFVTAAVLALFTALTWGYAIEQSKTQISAWLANQSLMRDIAVLLSVDIIVQLTFCVFSACSRPHAELRRRMRIIRTVLTFFPGLMIFPVVFSMLVQVIFALPGTSFSLIAYGMAGAILVIVPAGTWLLRRLLPEHELRLETLFLSLVLIAILGVIATVNGTTQNKGVGSVDWLASLGFAVLLTMGIIFGLIINRWKGRKRR